MKKDFTKRVKKELPNKSFSILTLVFLIILIIGIALIILTEKGAFLPKAVTFNPSGEENVYSEFSVSRMTDGFASFSDSKGNKVDYAAYYIINNGNCVVAVMDSESKTKLNDIYNYSVSPTGDEPSPITIKGVSTKMDKDLQSTAIEAFRIMFNISGDVTDENIVATIGSNYIEVGVVPGSPLYAISAIIMLLGLAGVLIVCGLKISMTVNQKKAEKTSNLDYDEIIKEFDGAYINKTAKTIITEHYLIGSGGLGVYGAIRKSDVIWAYSKAGRVNMIAATNNVYVELSDGTFAVCASAKASGEKAKASFDDAKKHIFEALPDVLIGLTKENMLKAKAITDKK